MRLARPSRSGAPARTVRANSMITSSWLRALLGGPEWKLLAAIVALAVILRVDAIDLVRFDSPVVNTLTDGRQFLRGGALPLIGTPTGLGLHNPPGLTYVMMLPALLAADAVRGATVFMLLVAIAGIVLTFVVARRYFGPRVAVAAAALWAVSPAATSYAREIAPTALVATLMVVCIYGLLLAVVDERPWGWTLAASMAGCMVALSLRAVILVPALLLLACLYCRRVGWVHVLLGACIAILVLGPFLYYENTIRMADLRSAWQSVRQQNVAWAHVSDAADTVRHAFAGDPASPATTALALWAARITSWALPALDQALGWLVLASSLVWWPLAVRAWSHWKERTKPQQYVVMGVCVSVPLILSGLIPSAASDRSVAILQAPLMLGVGVAMDTVMLPSSRRAFGRISSKAGILVAGLVLALLIAYQAFSVVGMRDDAAHSDATPLGLSYRFWRETATLVRRLAIGAGTDQVWVLNTEKMPITDARLLLDYALGNGPDSVYLQSDALLLPAGRPAIYLCLQSRPSRPAGDAAALGQQTAMVVSPGGRYSATVYQREPVDVSKVLGQVEEEAIVAFPDGLRLLGYALPDAPSPGLPFDLVTYWTWQNAEPPPAREHRRVIVSVQAPQGAESVSEASGMGLEETWWQEGYLLRQTRRLLVPEDTPEGEYALAVSMTCEPAQGACDWLADIALPVTSTATIGTIPIGR